jgi:FMN phosphatase YigB (HAD superfamily)
VVPSRKVLAFDLFGTLVDPAAISTELGQVLGDDCQADRLVELYDHLQPFPDAVSALHELAGLDYELVVFSNGTPAMISNCLHNSGLAEFFWPVISVSSTRAAGGLTSP